MRHRGPSAVGRAFPFHPKPINLQSIPEESTRPAIKQPEDVGEHPDDRIIPPIDDDPPDRPDNADADVIDLEDEEVEDWETDEEDVEMAIGDTIQDGFTEYVLLLSCDIQEES